MYNKIVARIHYAYNTIISAFKSVFIVHVFSSIKVKRKAKDPGNATLKYLCVNTVYF
jgi:hypothetical protein